MNRLFWTSLALDDLQSISAYIETQSSLSTANRVCRAIDNSAQQLRHFSELGRAGLELDTLELVVAQFPTYLLEYRVAPFHTVWIWHAAQSRHRSVPI